MVEDIRDEAKTDLVVAVDVRQLSIHLSSWFDEDIDEESTAIVGDEIKITCSFENPDVVYPIPRVQLKMLDGDKESLLTESIMNEKENKIYISRNVTREDKYVSFICESTQTLQGEDIFHSRVSTPSLHVVQPPTMEYQEFPDAYIVKEDEQDGAIVVPLKFYSIPRPSENDVFWRVREIFDSENTTGNVYKNLSVPFILYPNSKHKHFVTYPIENLGEDLYLVTIEIYNVTSSWTIELDIINEHGDLSHSLPTIILQKIEPLPDSTNVKKEGLSLVIIVAIIFILIILVVLVAIIACFTKERIRRGNEEMDEEIVKKVKKYKENGNRQKVDLDSISDDKVQHLEDRLLAGHSTHPTFHRSESDQKTRNVKTKDQIDGPNGVVPELKNGKKNSSHHTRRQIDKNGPDMQIDISLENDNHAEMDSQMFNEELLNVHTNQLDVYGGLQELDPELVRRHSSVFKDNGNQEENDTMIRTPDGTILRLSGPTNYPVMSRPPVNFTFERTPSRKTSQIHFMGPSEGPS